MEWSKRLLLVALAAGVQAQAPPPAGPKLQPAPVCARPDVGGTTLHAAQPVTPAMAAQQGIDGTVLVVVSLDEQSHLTAARIQSSPSPILNGPALVAVYHSYFRTAIRGCKPVAADFIFSVGFNASDRDVPDAAGGTALAPTVIVSARGEATRPADVAFIHAQFVTRDADRAQAIAVNNAAFNAFRETVTAPGPSGPRVTTAFYNVFAERQRVPDAPAGAAPSQAPVFVASHEAVVEVPLEATRSVLAAAADAGATTLSVVYSVWNARDLYDAAVAAAVRNAAPRAQRVAAAHHRRLGRVLATDVTYADTDTDEPGTPQPLGRPPVPPPPAPVNLAMRVTVTYALEF